MRLMNINGWRPVAAYELKLCIMMRYESCDTALCSSNKVTEDHPCCANCHGIYDFLLALSNNLTYKKLNISNKLMQQSAYCV